MSRRKSKEPVAQEPVAQVCLYGTREIGFAYLASGPQLAAPIAAKGGWNADETRPSGAYLSLTEIVERAKEDLRALGVRQGHVIVFFPGGERCAKTPVDEYEAVADMRLEPAPVVLVTPEMIAEAGRSLGATRGAPAIEPRTVATRSPAQRGSRAPRAASPADTPSPLGWTTSGKPIPPVPAELGELEKAASVAVGTHGIFDPHASPAVAAASAALRAHLESYARDFTAEEHREAERIVAEHKWATHATMDRYLRYAHNGIEARHRRAAEEIEQAERRRGLR